MRAESQLVVILAHIEGSKIEVHRTGAWCKWSGPVRELVLAMQQGVLFRVTRMPRTIWAEQIDGILTRACWTNEKDALNDLGTDATIVEFIEVL